MKNGEVRDALLHHSDRGTPPDEATPDGNNSLYCFNFLTQRDLAADPNGALARTPTIVSQFLDPLIATIRCGRQRSG
jgi:hypothetical protein